MFAGKTVELELLMVSDSPEPSCLTLEGEPRMVGRGLRCISSLSLGEECRGQMAIRPGEGATTGSEFCFWILCLPPPPAHSSRQGALWSRVPSPILCGRGSEYLGAAGDNGTGEGG